MRVLAFGDIHGCLASFDALLDWVKPTREDVIITLGDYVDRGPDSRGVIDRLIELRERLNLICIRGNHEKMMLDAQRGGRGEKKMWLSVGGVETLASYGIAAGNVTTLDGIPREHWDFSLKFGCEDIRPHPNGETCECPQHRLTRKYLREFLNALFEWERFRCPHCGESIQGRE